MGALSWSPYSYSPLLPSLCAVAMEAMVAMVHRGVGGTHAATLEATMLLGPVGGALEVALEAAPAVAQAVVGPVPVPPQVCVPYWDK